MGVHVTGRHHCICATAVINLWSAVGLTSMLQMGQEGGGVGLQ